MQELGNSLGFFCGWTLATIFEKFLSLEHEGYLIAALTAATFGVIIDSCLFKQMKLTLSPHKKHESRSVEIIAERNYRDGGVSSISGDTIQQVIDAISKEYKLTERQSEVFGYLARGRNISFIKEKLTLSTPTVKSHTYNIYQKLGVHTHQELIDLVENRFKQRTAGH